jgi:hypothetical protein
MEFVKDIRKYKKEIIGLKMDSYSQLVSFVVWLNAIAYTIYYFSSETPTNLYPIPYTVFR